LDMTFYAVYVRYEFPVLPAKTNVKTKFPFSFESF
jgi:hypothetical protein